ncbi:DUF6449 domain-containing protein [Geosporobacter ferrireducens]|uniref:DUF6449 domain-containing protein n=1 Tax=Geosporobacter ferrireducens TaxID=1424294 RepID=A0A1D8GIK0_9FIRM|nr:DUF6449 domain-containing protein [Geosporobacter ferrireducens]AOT70721.1 hypothetical protein Gferi_14735 [Geosporobacter ferrireducens]MTI57525.1 ABC transporter permease [Geosporobacter ferrireducens]
MTSKISLFSKGLFTANIKRFWWVSALYAFILFFIVPFRYMMFDPNAQNEWKRDLLEATINFFSGRNDIQMIMIAALPTALAVLLFRYLMSGKATAMIHSLPYSRRTLYFNQLTAGFLLLTAPVLLIGVIMAGLKIFTPLGIYYSMLSLLQWMGMTILFNTLFFSIAVFVGMFTGNSVAHIAFTYILHLLPVAIYVLVRDNIAAWLYGFSVSNNYDPFFDKLPWFVLFNNSPAQPFLPWKNVFGYLTVVLLFLAAAGYAYEKRKLEAAGDIIAFTFFRPIFKYGLTICAMLMGGLYFRSISEGALSIFLMGYLLSSLLAYGTAEILMQKSFKVWHTYRGYLVYLAVVSALLVSMQADVFGYARQIPELDEVEKVYFGYYANIWTSEDPATDPRYKNMHHEANTFFSDPENMKNIIALHTQLVQQPRQKVTGPSPYIVYILKNGKYQVRQYTIDEKQYASLLKPIYESREYKKAKYPIVVQKPEEIKWIQINDNRTSKKPLILADSPEMREFMGLFQDEVRSMTFEEMSAPSNGNVYMQIADNKDKYYYYELRKDFKSMIAWLEEKDYYENLVLLPKDIEYAVLRKEGVIAQAGRNGTASNAPDSVEIKDPEILRELLEISETAQYTYERVSIYVDFYIRGPYGPHSYRTPLYTNVPISDALKSYIETLN